MPLVTPLRVDRLVCGDRVQPRPYFATLLELVAFQVHLKKGSLKHVFGQAGIAKVPTQVAVQGPLVSVDQLVERRRIGVPAILQKQLLIAGL